MKQKGMTMIALLCGVVCALAVYSYTNAVQADAQAARDEALERYGGEQVLVCVATRDIAPGEVLGSANVEVRQWLVDLLPEGAQDDLSSIEGKQASSGIAAGEVITEKRLEGEDGDLSVPSGMQAVSIEADTAAAVGGAVDVGSRVDVYATGADGAHLMVSGAQVLASGSKTSSRIWVTLAVADDQVQELVAATQKTVLYLTLPSTGDKDGGE